MNDVRLLGVIGHPINHSLSPRMHNAAFGAAGAGYFYVPLDVRPEQLPDAVRGLAALNFAGFNVTLPHKETILPLLDQLDYPARISGAVNTVSVGEEGLAGTNTDGSGFVAACAAAGVDFAGSRVLLVGAGGAAAAVGAAVLQEGARELDIVNRTARRAEELRSRLAAVSGVAEIRARPLEGVSGVAQKAGVVINATYLGMKDGDPLPVPPEGFGPDKVVCDVVYRGGKDTQLIRKAREAGAQVVPGEEMLLYQGVQAQKIWTGREPDVGVMRDALVR